MNKSFKLIFYGMKAALSVALLTGCIGPLVKIEKIDEAVRSKVTIYKDDNILNRNGVTALGIIEATSCRNLIWEPPASLENCTAQMQMQAARLGANGLIVGASVRKIANFVTNGINRNCWSTVDCSGVAIVIVKDSPENSGND